MGSLTPIPANLLKNFDVDLQKLYHDVIQKELKFQSKKSVHKIKVALKEVVDAYRMEYGVEHSNSIRFDSPAKRCAYVLKHSPCFTSAVAKHFFRMIRANQQILHKCLHSGQLNLCCLGGGPASDAVAISKIISGVYHSTWIKTHRTLKFQVTIVDINEDWEITAKNVLDILKTSEEFFEVEGLELSFRFCRADLTEPTDVKVQEALRSADIVTMVFFLSAVNRSKAIEKGFRMVQEIMERMKSGAFIFFLDSAKTINYEQMSEAANLKHLEQIYGSHSEQFHTLSLSSVRTFLDLYKKDLGRLLCMTYCFVSVSVWTKMDNTLRFLLSKEPNGIVKKRQLAHSELDIQRTTKLTNRMFTFRAQVRKLLVTYFTDGESDDMEEEEDAFDTLLEKYLEFIPQYLFQTKEKKRRIFTGPPLSI
ncbi:uncharacterized protein TNIN_448911 [Trichonephila inaurata madagascariensis]|uniref:Uncharacterized protein n=1 Tax=Trichonephila inaurata madagascariensis TaxID=2747483 RepID=A0A8X6Y022_9ARAC|nr:uncharacterized protein TNIN_448911 [Trichonephila inaurata madagascariensis]